MEVGGRVSATEVFLIRSSVGKSKSKLVFSSACGAAVRNGGKGVGQPLDNEGISIVGQFGKLYELGFITSAARGVEIGVGFQPPTAFLRLSCGEPPRERQRLQEPQRKVAGLDSHLQSVERKKSFIAPVRSSVCDRS